MLNAGFNFDAEPQNFPDDQVRIEIELQKVFLLSNGERSRVGVPLEARTEIHVWLFYPCVGALWYKCLTTNYTEPFDQWPSVLQLFLDRKDVYECLAQEGYFYVSSRFPTKFRELLPADLGDRPP
jgi:hypothetical protein